MVVQHNLGAMNSSRQLGITTNVQADSSRKLSSGYRINKASDDAAGLSISEKMRKQIRGLDRASDNAEEGISLVQTADGALEEVQEMLQRMNELSIQAANGTNSQTDREYIQGEVDQLKTEIDRVAATVKFNEIYLLDGHLADPSKAGKATKAYEACLEETERGLDGFYATDLRDGKTVSLADINARGGMNIVYAEITHDVATTQTGSGTSAAPYATDPAYDSLKNTLETQIVPQAVVGIVDTFSDTFGYLRDSTIGIGLYLYYDSGSSTLASVTLGYSGVPGVSGSLDYKLSVNMAAVNYNTATGQIVNRDDLEVTVVHEMMHALMDETLTAGMLGYDSSAKAFSNAFPGWFIEGMAQAAAGGCYNGNDWVNGGDGSGTGNSGLGITPTTSLNVISSRLATGGNALGSNGTPSEYGTGYLACMYLGYLVSGSSTVNETSITQGLDKLMNEIKKGTSLDRAIANLTGYAGLSDFQTRFSTDAAQFVLDLVTAVGSDGTGGLSYNNYASSPGILPDSSLDIGLFKLDTDVATVTNVYPSGYEVLTGGNGSSTGGTAAPTGSTSWGPGGPGGSGTSINLPDTNQPLEEPNEYIGGLKLQVGADSQQWMTIYIEGISTRRIGVHNVNVQTEENATRSIDMVAFALQQVSTQRSALGAYQNRLEHTVKNLDNIVENTQASESLIRDTDMAEEMVRHSNNTILLQAGQAMLAQANQSNQGVLQLIT